MVPSKTALETKLSPGILREVGETAFYDPKSYLPEVEAFLNEEQIFPFEFVNQDGTFQRMASMLATSSYPYVVLVGDNGIGKTMMVDHLIRGIQGNGDLEELVGNSDSLRRDFTALRQKAALFEHRDYLLLPNMRTPRRVQAISYTDGQIERDIPVAEEFCRDIAETLKGYPTDHETDIRFQFDEADFKRYTQAKIKEFYVGLHALVNSLVEEHEDVALVTITPKQKKPQAKQQPFSATWTFLNSGVNCARYKKEAGFQSRSKGITKPQIERGLAHNYQSRIVSNILEKLMEHLTHADIEGKMPGDVQEIIFDEFKEYNRQVLKPFAEAYGQKDFTQAGLISELRQGPRYRHMPPISSATLADIEVRIQVMRDRYTTDDCSPELLRWMDSVVGYFKEERRQVARTISEMLEEKNNHDSIKSRLTDSKTRNKDEISDGKAEAEYIGQFRLRHGDHRMPVDRIFQPNIFKDPSASGKVSSITIRDFSGDGLFGTFREHDINVPPHMALSSLGMYFQGGILVFPDEFSAFVDAMRNSDDEGGGSSGSMRERFLEALQKGTITLMDKGISFTFDAPRMILGCDNEDPFTYLEGLIDEKSDGALRDRITCISVPGYQENTPDARQGSLRVIFDAATRWNLKRNHSTDDHHRGTDDNAGARDNTGARLDADVRLAPEAADYLLRETIRGDALLSLSYRSLSKRVEGVLDLAAQRGEREVTLETLRALVRKQADPLQFYRIDSDAQDEDGYTSLPKEQVGMINGLGVVSRETALKPIDAGYRCGISSYLVQRRDPLPKDKERFSLVDSEQLLTDSDTDKGFDLARDYVLNLVHTLRPEGLSDKEGWQVRTEFYGNLDGISGNSASLGIAISIVSTLAGDPIYKNRFVTGSIQPQDGRVGQIGELLYKAMVPARLQSLAHNGEAQDMYLLFPAGNRKEFVQEIMIDPYGIEQRITSIPVQTFEQAYFLATCGPTISTEDIAQIETRSKRHFEGAQQRIRERFATIDQVIMPGRSEVGGPYQREAS